MRRAIYAGSFDPVHNGHIDIIERAIDLFPTRRITVIVANNRDKNHYFSIEARMVMMQKALSHLADKVEIISYEGIIADWANENDADVMIRGLRDGFDLSYEFNLEQFTRGTSGLETVYLTPKTINLNTSSSLVRMFISTNKFVAAKDLVPKNVLQYIETSISYIN